MLVRNSMRGYIAALVTLLLLACERDGNSSQKIQVTEYKVAVVVPETNQQCWERTVTWAIDNVKKAQEGLPQRVDIIVEWYDENAATLTDNLKQIAQDDSYIAVVGPMASTNARKAAEALGRNKKTLILPIATSTEFQRIVAGKGYVWNLAQSDLTQGEILLTQAKTSEFDYISLLTSDSDYGRSFSDWIAYQAVELGLEVSDIIVYRSEEELRQAVNKFHNYYRHHATMVVFAPDKAEDAVVFDEEYGKLLKADKRLKFPEVICSDVVNSAEIAHRLINRVYEGISPSANPMSGFVSAYTTRFGEEPICGEAHLYDAITLLAFALTAKEEGATLNDALLRVTDVDGEGRYSWLPDDMRQQFAELQAGRTPKLSGVTGDWTFDERNHSSVLNTIYSHWVLRDGKYTTLEYLSPDGGMRTTSTLQAWDTQTQMLQEFSEKQEDISYGVLQDRWAVVIGTSDTWVNYRHQADALAMYQLLKRHGYTDDRIILIIEDNIAYDSHNIYPGVVRVKPDGENVYEEVVVDYHLSDIDIADLEQIMLGNSSEKLPHVIEADKQDNVIVFWCGHGNYNKLAWGEYKTISGYQIHNLIGAMHNAGRYRKMLFAMDACYSGSIGEACEGLPGVLFITAAHAYETSKADMKDLEMGIWLSNGFTRAFQEAIDDNPNVTLHNLYHKLARQTVGSHATIYNYVHYGNLYTNTMREFLE